MLHHMHSRIYEKQRCQNDIVSVFTGWFTFDKYLDCCAAESLENGD